MAAEKPFTVCCFIVIACCVGVQAHLGQENRHHHGVDGSDTVNIVYKWNMVEPELLSQVNVEKMERQGHYIHRNIYISDIKIYNDTLYLIMTPKFRNGTLVALGYLPLYWNDSTIHENHPIYPFPNYKLHSEQSCDGLKSVTSFEIDPEGIMWVVINNEAKLWFEQLNSTYYCRPILKLIDLNDFSYTSYDFPESVVGSDYYLNDIVVDDYDGGYAYITDNSKINPGIVVYSRRKKRSWKLKGDGTMFGNVPHELKIFSSTSLGCQFNINDGVTHRYVFYGCFCDEIRAVRTSWLRDESSVNKPFESSTVGRTLTARISAIITDEFGYIYYGLSDGGSFFRLDPNKNYTDKSVGFEGLTFGSSFRWEIRRFAFDERNNLYVLIFRWAPHGYMRFNKDAYVIARIDVKARSYFYDGSIEKMKEESNSGASKGRWFSYQFFSIMVPAAYFILYENSV